MKSKYIKELNDYFYGYKLFFRDWNNPNFRTPKDKENYSYKKKYINNNFNDRANTNDVEEIKANKKKLKIKNISNDIL